MIKPKNPDPGLKVRLNRKKDGMNKDELEKRTKQAITFFEEGFNCSQAVFMAYSDIFGIKQETAAKLATSFGGGMGRLREVCGAVSGMFLVLGLQYPFIDTTDKVAKSNNYKAVQRTANEFKFIMGSYICAELLKLKHEPQDPESSERNEAYYTSRPCIRCVAVAAEIIGKELLFKNPNGASTREETVNILNSRLIN